MKVLILAGGMATRLHPLTKRTPKALVNVAGRPFIEWQIKSLVNQGYTEVVISIGYLGEQIKNILGDGKYLGAKLHFSNDGESPLGTGGAVKKSLDLLSNDFFVLYGDTYLPVSFKKIENYFRNKDKLGLMTILQNNNLYDTSNIVVQNNEIIKYSKNNLKANYIDYGLSIFKKSAFSFINKHSFDLSSIFTDLINKKELANYLVKDRFYEIGTPDSLLETRKYLEEQKWNL